MIGISIADGGFELRCGEPIGRRRYLDELTVGRLREFSSRYAKLREMDGSQSLAGLLSLGRDLFDFLDGDAGDLTALIDRSSRPLHFEIASDRRRPSVPEMALLRAPWELLANAHGFLAADVILNFGPVRRLGRPEPPPLLDQYRLGLVFMAAAPRGVAELDYEAEETAIMSAVGATELDLLVEDSGNPERLGERIGELPAMQVLHLGCHGDNAWRPADAPEAVPKPVLWLEDDTGDELPTDAGTLIESLRAHRPRLLFLSACLTATAGERRNADGNAAMPQARGALAQTLAEAMIDGGIPAVLGWDGSVLDGAATGFAAKLYDGLAERKTLADAVASARRAILNSSEEWQRRDWHLARLWLGPQGGGAIVGGKTRRALLPATHGQKQFLVKQRQQVPVASHEMFVGRRRELQTALRALRDGEHPGVLLHGMGRLGKSSLAARIANRRPDLKLAVVFEHYGALDIMAALEEALRTHRAASDAVREASRRVREDSTRLEQELTLLLAGPCAQAGDAGAPVLLVIDDLERILKWDDQRQQHRVDPTVAPTLCAVLRAFDPAATDSRLLITSRFRFHLDGVEQALLDLPLPPLSSAAQGKLAMRQIDVARDAGLAGAALATRESLLARVPTIARGNPGLQDLIGRKLVLSPAVTPERAADALQEMESWLTQGVLPADAEVRAFLENLAVDHLLDLAREAGRELLRGLTLFSLPVPEAVADLLAGTVQASLTALRDLGLIDPHEDVVDHRQPALAANALAEGRLAPLDDAECGDVARQTAQSLFASWGGVAGETRPASCDLELARLGLIAGDGEIVASCAASAVALLNGNSSERAAVLGQAAIELLDACEHDVPWRLLSETAKAAAKIGDGAKADLLLSRGIEALDQQRAAGAAIDLTAAVFLAYEQANRLRTRGELDQAQRLYEDAAQFAIAAGHEVGAAIARSQIADILQSRGELDEALRICRDEQLPIYERLGDARSRALTMGQIADMLQSRGELDEALRIRRDEELPVYERLGDVRERAVTMGQIADILQVRGDLDEALRIRRDEQLPVYERLGDVRERAVTIGKIADILQSRGELDEALRICWHEQLPVYERLGDVRSRAVTMGSIAAILESRGEFDEALRIRRGEELPIYERLGDVHSRAVAIGKIADILHSRGELDEALRIRRDEQLPVYERLGDVRGRSVTMGKIAEILRRRGELDEARKLQEERLQVNRRLGDAEGIAATLWDLARLDLAEEKSDEAVPRIVEAYETVLRLGRAEGIAAIGATFGQILAAAGNHATALEVLRRSAEMFRKLGQEASARKMEEIIRQLGLDSSAA